MLVDQFGRPLRDGEPPILEIIESVASFGYDLDVKKPDGSSAYEKAKFFRSHKFRCRAEDEDDASRTAWEWCVEEVMEDIKEFQLRRARKEAQRAGRTAA